MPTAINFREVCFGGLLSLEINSKDSVEGIYWINDKFESFAESSCLMFHCAGGILFLIVVV